jgi:monoamine oxidase
MAALELAAHGYDVTVVEARDRVGGRIHTLDLGDGVWANAGAEWLNTSDVLAHELVGRYRLGLVERHGFERVAVHGRLNQREELPAVVAHELDDLAADVSAPQEPWNDEAVQALDAISVAAFLRELDLDADDHAWMLADIRGEFMTHAEEVSLASYVLVSALTDGDRSTRLELGTAALTDAMTDELGAERIHLGEPAVRIDHDATGVRVQTTRSTYSADAVIVAVPLGPLQRIRFVPSTAVPWLGQGRGGKLFVPYRARDWDERQTEQQAYCATDFVYETASHHDGDVGVLSAYSLDPLRPSAVEAAFGTWFHDPPRAGPPVAAWWSGEPESGTTYSAPRPGDLESLRELRRPRGRIFLAGEHTEIMFGYVESALTSGRRAAHDAMARVL